MTPSLLSAGFSWIHFTSLNGTCTESIHLDPVHEFIFECEISSDRILHHIHVVPVLIFGVSLEDLLGSAPSQVLPLSPHLLELDADLVEGLRDDSNEDVLHHPSQEEDHGHEVEGGLPGVQRVRGPVHDVDPALLQT